MKLKKEQICARVEGSHPGAQIPEGKKVTACLGDPPAADQCHVSTEPQPLC